MGEVFEFGLGDEVEVIFRGRVRARVRSGSRREAYLVEGVTWWGAPGDRCIGVAVLRGPAVPKAANDNAGTAL